MGCLCSGGDAVAYERKLSTGTSSRGLVVQEAVDSKSDYELKETKPPAPKEADPSISPVHSPAAKSNAEDPVKRVVLDEPQKSSQPTLSQFGDGILVAQSRKDGVVLAKMENGALAYLQPGSAVGLITEEEAAANQLRSGLSGDVKDRDTQFFAKMREQKESQLREENAKEVCV